MNKPEKALFLCLREKNKMKKKEKNPENLKSKGCAEQNFIHK